MSGYSIIDYHAENPDVPEGQMPVPTHARVRMFLKSGEVIDENFVLPVVKTLDDLIGEKVQQRIAELDKGIRAVDESVVVDVGADPLSVGYTDETPALATAAKEATQIKEVKEGEAK